MKFSLAVGIDTHFHQKTSFSCLIPWESESILVSEVKALMKDFIIQLFFQFNLSPTWDVDASPHIFQNSCWGCCFVGVLRPISKSNLELLQVVEDYRCDGVLETLVVNTQLELLKNQKSFPRIFVFILSIMNTSTKTPRTKLQGNLTERSAKKKASPSSRTTRFESFAYLIKFTANILLAIGVRTGRCFNMTASNSVKELAIVTPSRAFLFKALRLVERVSKDSFCYKFYKWIDLVRNEISKRLSHSITNQQQIHNKATSTVGFYLENFSDDTLQKISGKKQLIENACMPVQFELLHRQADMAVKIPRISEAFLTTQQTTIPRQGIAESCKKPHELWIKIGVKKVKQAPTSIILE